MAEFCPLELDFDCGACQSFWGRLGTGVGGWNLILILGTLNPKTLNPKPRVSGAACKLSPGWAVGVGVAEGLGGVGVAGQGCWGVGLGLGWKLTAQGVQREQ